MEKKLTDREVRIIYVPPMTVTSIHYIRGIESEPRTAEAINKFIKENNLAKFKPDFRHFGFNNPDGIPDEDPNHGYERWISIPNDMAVDEPFVKKIFSGGIYAAHMIPFGLWEEGWLPLHDWIIINDKYEMEVGDSACGGCCGWLEERLNWINWLEKEPQMIYSNYDSTLQLDLLLPIKKK